MVINFIATSHLLYCFLCFLRLYFISNYNINLNSATDPMSLIAYTHTRTHINILYNYSTSTNCPMANITHIHCIIKSRKFSPVGTFSLTSHQDLYCTKSFFIYQIFIPPSDAFRALRKTDHCCTYTHKDLKCTHMRHKAKQVCGCINDTGKTLEQ